MIWGERTWALGALSYTESRDTNLRQVEATLLYNLRLQGYKVTLFNLAKLDA